MSLQVESAGVPAADLVAESGRVHSGCRRALTIQAPRSRAQGRARGARNGVRGYIRAPS